MYDTVQKLKALAHKLDPPETSYHFTRFFLLRFLGFIHLIAFCALAQQLDPLIGPDGLLPADAYLDRVRAYYANPVLNVPTIFWIDRTNAFMHGACDLGIVLSVLLLCGVTNALLPAALWVIYMSFIHIGQIFYGYGWETLTLEATFLAIFLCPIAGWKPFPETPPSKAVIWFYRWLVFRVMFGAGLIKLRGDPCWINLTCLIYHYETQPIPNPISWYLTQMPVWFHKLGALWNHMTELIMPLGLFGPRRWRTIAGLFIVAFQTMLILSGNLSWLNYLTIAICIPCFDDRTLRRFVPRRWRDISHRKTAPVPRSQTYVINALTVLILCLSVHPALNLLSPQQRMNASFDPLHLVNTYGAFGSVGRIRREIIIEGTADSDPLHAHWRAYEFKAKPGNVYRRPPFIAPYQYRIDWQIWFAAMSTVGRNPWLMHFIDKLLQNDRGALSLIADNPFPDRPPQYIRADLYEYHFTTFADTTGAWWTRTRLETYLPPVSLDDPAFQTYLHRYGWTH